MKHLNFIQSVHFKYCTLQKYIQIVQCNLYILYTFGVLLYLYIHTEHLRSTLLCNLYTFGDKLYTLGMQSIHIVHFKCTIYTHNRKLYIYGVHFIQSVECNLYKL